MSVTTEVAFETDREFEVVDGKPEEKVMGNARHGGVGARLLARILTHVEAHELGGVYGPDTTFQIGSNERLPDIAFISAARIPPEGEPDDKWPMAPDLAVEVISPNDLWVKVNRKIYDYFAAGALQVWLISLEHHTISVYRAPTQVSILTEDDELTCEELLPGFRCRISEIFKQPARSQPSS
ncbi:MAG: Uma2 family endonuclease [Blastocatellia bacterium]